MKLGTKLEILSVSTILIADINRPYQLLNPTSDTRYLKVLLQRDSNPIRKKIEDRIEPKHHVAGGMVSILEPPPIYLTGCYRKNQTKIIPDSNRM